MTKKTLIDSLSVYPDDSEVVIVDPETLNRYSISFITWKNSAERVNIYFDKKQ